jgi:hypothetical protein
MHQPWDMHRISTTSPAPPPIHIPVALLGDGKLLNSILLINTFVVMVPDGWSSPGEPLRTLI